MGGLDVQSILFVAEEAGSDVGRRLPKKNERATGDTFSVPNRRQRSRDAA